METFFEKRLFEFIKTYNEPKCIITKEKPFIELSQFLSQKIETYVREKCIYKHTYPDLTIYSKTHSRDSKFIAFIYYYLRYALSQIKPHGSTLHTFIYLTPYKKKFPSKPPITSHHINTGFTLGDHSRIYLYRREELFKVLIHELVHAYEIDNSDINNLQKPVQDFFHRTENLLINEAYTDTIACMFNAIIYKLFAKLIGHEAPYDPIAHEARYIQKKASQVLAFLGYDLKKNKYPAAQENTNILSYYVLKAVLFNKQFKKKLESERLYIQNPHIWANDLYMRLQSLTEKRHDNNRTLKMCSLDIDTLPKFKLLKTLMSLSIHQ